MLQRKGPGMASAREAREGNLFLREICDAQVTLPATCDASCQYAVFHMQSDVFLILMSSRLGFFIVEANHCCEC